MLFVGTSGWIYKGWAGSFYPEDLGKSGELEFYAGKFNTVEINATFYRLPSRRMVQGWHQRSPDQFVFAVKGSRYITHLKRLRVDRRSMDKYFNRVKYLKEKCGPILWQLPPNLPYDAERLAKFLGRLPQEYRHAVEFRHPSWYDHKDTFEVLREHRAGHVTLSSQRMPMNQTLTADFTYIRFHGLAGGAAHDYTRSELQPWVKYCRACLNQGTTVYAYFNNDWNTRAPLNAEMLRSMVEHSATRRSSTRPGASVPLSSPPRRERRVAAPAPSR